MIRMNPAHDCVSPAGCIDLRGETPPPGQVNVQHQDKPLSYMIDDFKRCSQGYSKQADGCCHKTVVERCSDCSFKEECKHDWIMESPYNKQELSFCKKCNALKRLTEEK